MYNQKLDSTFSNVFHAFFGVLVVYLFIGWCEFGK